MYKDDIKDLYRQKRESRRIILLDFFEIYIKLRLFFPQLLEERNNLINMVQLYFDADDNECCVLKEMCNQYGNLEDHDGVDELLETFDEMYDNIFDYCQNTFVDYQSFLELYGNFSDLLFYKINCLITSENYDQNLRYKYRMIMRKRNFSVFDEEYKQKVLLMLPSLPRLGDDLDGEV